MILLIFGITCEATPPDSAVPGQIDSARIDPRLTEGLADGDERIAVSFVRVVSDAQFLAVTNRYHIRVSSVCLAAGGMGGSHGVPEPRVPNDSMINQVRQTAMGLLRHGLESTRRRIVQSGILDMEADLLLTDSLRTRAQSFLGTAQRISAAMTELSWGEAIICGFEGTATTVAVDRLVLDTDVATIIRRAAGLQRAVQLRSEGSPPPEPLIPEQIRAMSGRALQQALAEILQ